MNTQISVLAGVALLFVWAVLAFGMALETGWAHVPLAAAVILFARAIVLGVRPAGDESGRPSS